ncbi:LysM peptidoglycan-binding domain-containing protein [Rossellomorea vietnamensis]|uniref:C40 family peptidase n=1 Tax=Rossellomorea vietnamensis TaxID=218284 RepID=UPI003D274B9C
MKKSIITVTTTALLSTSFVASASASDHKVQSGDSLWSISQKYNTSVLDLKKLNNLTGEIIYPNQVLKVVNTGSNLPVPSTPAPVKPAPVTNQSYTVKSGDTLSKIAYEHSISLSDLMSWNGITSHLIYPGQTLTIGKTNGSPVNSKPDTPKPESPTPPVNTGDSSYKVKSGDTLSHISMKYNMTVKSLKDLNGLSSDLIYVGQKLKVGASSVTPSTPPATSETDTTEIVTLAKSHLGIPYTWGGSTPEGFDCSGFIYYVHKQAGHSLPRYSSGGYYNRSYYVHTPQPGDLVFFENTYKKGISHLGIYLGDNQFIHAGDNGVEITSLNNSYWKSKFDGFKRLYDL